MARVIHLRKFGSNVLLSRPAGLEAFNAIRPTLDPNTPVEIDFDDVLTIAPSWFDEFITQLAEFMDGKVALQQTTNASVIAMLPILSADRTDAAGPVLKRALEMMPTYQRTS